MASFLAFLPRDGTNMTIDELAAALVKRRLPARIEADAEGAVIAFDGASDVLYVLARDGRVLRAELSPRQLSDPINVALHSIGFDYVDEDHARWTEHFT